MMFKLFFLIINLGLVKPFTSSTVLFENRVKLGVIPYLATIHNDDNLLCCGVIVDEDWVIAPANCVRGNQSFFISTESNLFGTFGQTVVGNNVFFIDPFSESDDIALIQTETPINFNDNVKAIDIMSEEKIDEVLEYTKYGIITGWGPSSGTKKIIKTLEQAKVDLMNPDECFKKLKRFNFTENLLICVSPKMKEFRSIYYGGPLIIEDQLVAINLREKFPIGSTYFVYTKVDSVLKAFVKKHIRYLKENMDYSHSSSESPTETFTEPTSSLTLSNSSSNNQNNVDYPHNSLESSTAASSEPNSSLTSSNSSSNNENNVDYPHNSSESSTAAFSEPPPSSSSSSLTSSNSSSNNDNNVDYPHNSSESSTAAFSEPPSSSSSFSSSLTSSNSLSNNKNNNDNHDDGELRSEAAGASSESNNMDYPHNSSESSTEAFSEPTSSSLSSSNSSSNNENNNDNDYDGESRSEAAGASFRSNNMDYPHNSSQSSAETFLNLFFLL